MASCRAIKFTHLEYNFNKCRGRLETAEHYYSCQYLDKEALEINKDPYKDIKKVDRQVSSDKEHLSSLLEELFNNYKAHSINVNLQDGCNNLRMGPAHTLLPFHFTSNSILTITNKLLDHLITLLERTEKPILTQNSHKPLSKQDFATIVRNRTKNVDFQLDSIVTYFQHYCRQHWTECCDYHYMSHGSSQ